jgi:hypothetical protein
MSERAKVLFKLLNLIDAVQAPCKRLRMLRCRTGPTYEDELVELLNWFTSTVNQFDMAYADWLRTYEGVAPPEKIDTVLKEFVGVLANSQRNCQKILCELQSGQEVPLQ